MQGRLGNLTNRKFGRLTVIKRQKTEKRGQTKWLCRCDCGNEKSIRAGSLLAGTTTSCGCFKKELWDKREHRTAYKSESEKLISAITILYIQYKTQAKKREYEFKLSIDEFEYLIKQRCRYCGKAPSQKISGNSYSNFVYNGIDRLDNSIGYIISNSVTCCGRCNKAKGIMTENEFLEMVNEVVEWQISTKVL